MEPKHIYRYREQAALYGLAAVALVAGLTKFFYTGLWAGYEPAFLRNLLPLTGTQLVYAAGAIETLAGSSLALRYRTRLVASIVTVWLLAITVTVASMGLWTIALRDLGLAVLAYTVAAE
ncbi:MAG: DoxX family membrane protein [Candidatus Nanohaloarchaea archaeon]